MLERAWPPVRPNAVNGIAIQNETGAYVLTRVGGTWTVSVPDVAEPLPAASDRVQAFADALLSACPGRKESLGELDSSFAVDAPLAHISLDGAHRAAVVRSDVSGLCLLYGGHVYAFPDWRAEMFQRPAAWFRDSRLLDFSVDDVRRIEVSPLAGETWSARRVGDGFEFLTPARFVGVHVLGSAMEQFLLGVSAMRQGAVVAESVPGDTPPDMAVSLETGRDGRMRLEVHLSEEGGPVVRSSRLPLWFELDRDGLRKLDLNAFLLVDRRVADFAPGMVRVVRLFRGERAFGAKRAGNGWVDASGAWKHAGIDMLLWRLTSLQYEYGPERLPGTAVPALSVELLLEGAGSMLELDFYRDPALPHGQCWVRLSRGEDFFPVNDRVLNDLEGLLPASAQRGEAS
ncbi:hypothetical protein GGQ74_000677 [Desulfobaculum xiamenense]|uniref:DUF4340 domain-containing protein n=1 Tax=Desulfobaculum xiamenense TaxID=995050 RepID=A0A846QJ11_9BACT|nr:hypothetical protein [Desulfobaculum xiamenense]NJB67037.1 hypothetical protein [Desulfobaculum xiamenense]